MFVICAEGLIYLLLSNLHDCTFNNFNENEFIEFPFTRILFGLAPSPFSLLTTVIKYMSQYINPFMQNVVKWPNIL